MDPDECLKEIREIMRELRRYEQNSGTYARQLLERVEALDQWLTSGGFPPSAWRPPATAAPKKGHWG